MPLRRCIPQAEDVFALLSKAMKQSAEAMALAEKAAVDSLHRHVPSLSNQRPIRMLREEGAMSCPASSTSECTGASASVQSCMMAVFRAASGNPMSSPFTFPSLLCQLRTTNSSCVSSLINHFKTCACVDFQPMFDLHHPPHTHAPATTSSTLRTLMRQQQLRPPLPRIKHQCLFGVFRYDSDEFPYALNRSPSAKPPHVRRR